MRELELTRASITGVMLTLLLIHIVTLVYNVPCVDAQPQTWTVDDDGSADFHLIQEAINAANPGDTIYAHNGIYSEHLIVNKSLTLMGEERSLTIINGTSGAAVTIIADNVQVTEFTIRDGYRGIYIVNSDGNTISQNNILSNESEGLWAENSTSNIIAYNTISNNGFDGVYMYNVSETRLQGNTIVSNFPNGVYMEASYDNFLAYNTLSDNTNDGFRLEDSDNVSFVRNTVSWNHGAGVNLFNVSACSYHHNNLLNNSRQVRSDNSPNAWDNGAEGNYWSDYISTDQYKGPYQNETGSDGIGDTSYFINAENSDNYPFMGQIDFLDVGTWDETPQTTSISSNSTVSDLRFNNKEKLIRFNVTGESDMGFCRVTIPEVVVQGLWQGEYVVLIDGEEPIILDEGAIEAHIYIYLAYLHSEHEIIIKGTPAPDTTPPTITILSPENKTYAMNDVALNVAIDEPTSWIGYSIDGQVNITISGNTTMIELPDGAHTVAVYANDTTGNTGYSDTVHFSTDTVPPKIQINSPENKSYTSNSVSLSFFVNERTTWIGYSLNGHVNVTIEGNMTLVDLSSGAHAITIYANDSARNTGASETVHFSIETRGSITTVLSPELIVAVIVIIAVVTSVLVYAIRRKAKRAKGGS